MYPMENVLEVYTRPRVPSGDLYGFSARDPAGESGAVQRCAEGVEVDFDDGAGHAERPVLQHGGVQFAMGSRASITCGPS